MNLNKLDVFKNITLCIRDWYESEVGDLSNNDLSILKIFRLLFFIVADSPKLIKYFDFHCEPYGHNDKELLHISIKNPDFDIFKLSNSANSSEFRDVVPNFIMNIGINNEICKRITDLHKKNPNLIKYSALDLVDLNTYWGCYRKFYVPAKRKGIYSVACPNEEILNDYKIYKLDY